TPAPGPRSGPLARWSLAGAGSCRPGPGSPPIDTGAWAQRSPPASPRMTRPGTRQPSSQGTSCDSSDETACRGVPVAAPRPAEPERGLLGRLPGARIDGGDQLVHRLAHGQVQHFAVE